MLIFIEYLFITLLISIPIALLIRAIKGEMRNKPIKTEKYLASPVNAEDYITMYRILMQDLIDAGVPSTHLSYLGLIYKEAYLKRKHKDVINPKFMEHLEIGAKLIKAKPEVLIDLPECPMKTIKKTKEIRYRKLEDLSKTDFNYLKDLGILWEWYPKAPEFYKDIKKEK